MAKRTNKPATPKPTDAELNVIIDKNKKRATRGTIILVIGVILLLCTGIAMNGILIALSIIVIGIGYWFRVSARDAIKSCMTKTALIPALEAVFDNVKYFPEESISEQFIRHTDMGFDFCIDKITGSDRVKAEYRGVSIEMSDVQLSTIVEVTDEDGDVTEMDKMQFKGLWLICDFHKRFSADLLLREREGLGDRFAKSSVETENSAFNKQFYIQSDSAHDVFYILTPHMMEYIQAMDKKADGRTYMRFKKEGKLVLALDTGRDAFEVGKIRKASAEALREQFIDEVRYVTDLIDELRLVKTLYADAVRA